MANYLPPVVMQLTGDDDDLRRTLRAAKAEVRRFTADVAKMKATIKVDVDASGLRTQVTAAVNTATAGQRIDLPLGADADLLRASIRTAVSTAAGGHSIGVDTTVRDPMQLRQAVLAAVRWAAWGHKIEIPLTLRDPNGLRTQVTNAVRRAGRNRNININTNLNVRGTLAQIATIRGALAGLNATMRVGVNSTSGMLSSGGANWKLYGAIALAVLAGITVAAPMAAAAVTTTLPVAFGAVGAAALKSDADVKAAFADMKSSVGADIRAAAAPFKPYLIDAMAEVTEGVRELKAPLSDTFRAAGPLVDDVVDGVVGLGREALPDITRALQRSEPMMEGFSSALSIIGAGLGDMFDAITSGNAENLQKIWLNMGQGLRTTLRELGEMMGTLAGNEDAVESVAAAFELLGSSIEAITKIADVTAPAVNGLLKTLDSGMQQVGFWADVIGNLGDVFTGGWGESTGTIITAATATKGLGDAAKQAQGSTNLFGAAAERTKAALEGQKQAADSLRDSIFALNDANRSAFDDETAFSAKLDELTTAFRKNGATLDKNTEKGRLNRDAMSQAAAAHDKMIESGVAAGGSLASMTSKSNRLRSAMVRLAKDTGMSDAAARKYVNTLLGTPDSIKTMVKLERQDALSGLRAVQAQIKKTPGAKSITVKALNNAAISALEAVGLKTRRLKNGQIQIYAKNGQALGSIAAVAGAMANLNGRVSTTYVRTVYNKSFAAALRKQGATGGLWAGHDFKHRGRGYAGGGLVDGPGTETSDDVYAPWLSKNEFVVNAKQTRKHLDLLRAINEDRLRVEGFARGGYVTKSEREARKAARGDLTISRFGWAAGYRNTEFASALGKPADVGSLVGALNRWRGVIQKSTHGSTERRLLRSLDTSGKALLKNAKLHDKVSAELDKAKTKLADLRREWAEKKSSVAQSILGGTSVIASNGELGRPVNAQDVLNQSRDQMARTVQFASLIKQLKSKGLRGDVIDQIASAGVEGGYDTALALAGGTKGQIAELNKIRASTVTAANGAGTAVADAMYAAGIKSAEGLVKGLTSKEKAIEASMMRIAKSMEKAIKKALGIRSPSQVFAEIGGHLPTGLAVGIDAGTKHALIAARGLAMSTAQAAALDGGLTVGPRPTALRHAAGGSVVHYHYHAHVTVQGSVVTERKLIDAVERGMLRKGMRQPATYQNYKL